MENLTATARRKSGSRSGSHRYATWDSERFATKWEVSPQSDFDNFERSESFLHERIRCWLLRKKPRSLIAKSSGTPWSPTK
eukprot:1835391-Prymnesium_polylepis.1